QSADEDRLHHVLVVKRGQERIDHASSSSVSARCLTLSSRPSRLLYSRCPSFPKTTGRSSSASKTTSRASCRCTVDSSKRKCRNTPPNAFFKFSWVNSSV